jgi:hypothetical protein
LGGGSWDGSHLPPSVIPADAGISLVELVETSDALRS